MWCGGILGKCIYHGTSKLESSLHAWGDSTRQCDPQRHTSHSGQEEFIVHENVVGKDCVVSVGHKCFNQLCRSKTEGVKKVLNKSFLYKCFVSLSQE